MKLSEYVPQKNFKPAYVKGIRTDYFSEQMIEPNGF